MGFSDQGDLEATAPRTRGAVIKLAKFTDERIVRILLEAHRSPVAEVAQRHGVSEPSIYVWRKKFGDRGTYDVCRLKALE